MLCRFSGVERSPAVERWLQLSAVDADSSSRVAAIAASNTDTATLMEKLRQSTAVEPGRSYKKWIAAEQTLQAMAQCDEVSYGRLLGTLAGRRVRWKQRPTTADLDEAKILVDATIGYFLPILEAG